MKLTCVKIDGSIFANIDKVKVFQEARIFNSSPVMPRKCRVLLTKISYLINRGETFGTKEATDLFFGISKLFQHKDPSLRQMMYVVMKDLSPMAEDTIMVTSSIMKDTVTSSEVIYKPNAIRALCKVIDANTVQSVERIIKAAIVDKMPAVSTAALVSSYHLFPVAKDVVKRWANETQETVVTLKSYVQANRLEVIPGNSQMTQYHALGLLYEMRNHDKMALVKMIQQLSGVSRDHSNYSAISSSPVKCHMALVLLVRFTAKVMEDDPNMRKPLYPYLESWLRHKSDMVNFEAAKAICDLSNVDENELSPAISVLQLFLTSPRFVCRFAAIRILNKLSLVKPTIVATCNYDIENLITDSNRSIATYAITTLLKTGNEASVDRLMKQIPSFMYDISDEFKIIVVDAIRSLCLKFPSKQAVMLEFLSGVLRDEGGYEFKKGVVEAMFDMIKYVPDAKEEALAHLCEFIEDCEYTKLAARILHLIGIEGPKTSKPSKYIRFIYNRVVLENAVVRAAAVGALSKFGMVKNDPKLTHGIRILLTRCLQDPDDEVRDRAAFSLKFLNNETNAEKFLAHDSLYSIPTLEHQLVMYVSKNHFTKGFDISAIPSVTREEADAEALQAKKARIDTMPLVKPEIVPTSPGRALKENAAQSYANVLRDIKEFSSYGPLLKSSHQIELTESETEYVITAIKHIFKDHIVIQYNVKNTLTDTVLENISIVVEPDFAEAFVGEFVLPLNKLSGNQYGVIYASFSRTNPSGYDLATFSNTLKFTSKEYDPYSEQIEETGYDDSYDIEILEIIPSDYVIPTYIGNFDAAWNELGSDNELEEMFALSSISSIEEACSRVPDSLSMQPLEGTELSFSTSTHKMKLSGRSVNGERALVLAQMVYSSRSGVTLKVSVRSSSELLSQLLIEAF